MDERRARHDRRRGGAGARVGATRRKPAQAGHDLGGRDGDDLYVRSVNGREARWFRGVQDSHEAHISAGGVEKDVDLFETDDVDDVLDTAYRSKYGPRYPSIVPSILTPEARAATLRLAPR